MPEKRRGDARGPGLSIHDVIVSDRNPVPPLLATESFEWMGDEPISVERYTSESFYEREVELLWPRVWQMACRLDEIPEIGDYVVYDVCRFSIIVVRAGPGIADIRAYRNSCLHRGTTLLEGTGRCDHLVCPFHGFSWNLDGEFRGMPAPWDFPHVDERTMRLPQAQVATWGGFVFINMDEEAGPFEAYSAPLADHVAEYLPAYETRFVAHQVCWPCARPTTCSDRM